MQATPPTFLETKLYLQKKEKKNKTQKRAPRSGRAKRQRNKEATAKRETRTRGQDEALARRSKKTAPNACRHRKGPTKESVPRPRRVFQGPQPLSQQGTGPCSHPTGLSPSTCAHPLFAPVSGQNQFAFCLVRDPVGSCDLFFFWGRGRGKREGLGSVCADKAAHFCCHQTIAKRKIIKRKICLVLDAHASLVVFSPISKGKKGMVKRKRLCRGGACTRVGGRRRMPKGDKKNCGGPICTLSEITHRHTNSDRRLDPFTVYPNRSRHRRFSSFFYLGYLFLFFFLYCWCHPFVFRPSASRTR